MTLRLLFLLSLLIISCVHQPQNETPVRVERTPNHIDSFYNFELQSKRLNDKELQLVKNPKDATKYYSHGHKSQKSILIMHGLHESPDYMKGFADYFYNAGYNVISLRLPGHQTKNKEDLNQVTSTEWINSAEEAFKQAQEMGHHVEILGYSTGGTLAVYLGLMHSQNVNALYLIAPALALSDKVFITTQILGHTNLDLSKICKKGKEKKFLCRMLLNSDDQLKTMQKEGIITSPSAGLQVQNVINEIEKKFSPNKKYGPEYQPNYYQDLTDTYLQLRIPMLMVNSEADTVVQPEFNNKLMEHYSGTYRTILFQNNLGITHLKISKSSEDAFTKTKDSFNLNFQQIIDEIEKLRHDID